MTPNRDTELRETERMSCQAEVPLSDPMRAAWEAYRLTGEYANTRRWASHDAHVDGSLWAAFVVGYRAALLTRTEAGAVTFANAGDSEAQFIADGENLNCPTCGGSGHVDDAAQVGDGDTVIALLDAAGYITPGKLEQARAIAANFTHPQDASGDAERLANLIDSASALLSCVDDSGEWPMTADCLREALDAMQAKEAK